MEKSMANAQNIEVPPHESNGGLGAAVTFAERDGMPGVAVVPTPATLEQVTQEVLASLPEDPQAPLGRGYLGHIGLNGLDLVTTASL
jgi:hypothetical protein